MSSRNRRASGRHERRFSATLSEKFDDVTCGVVSLTLGATTQSKLEMRDPIPADLVLGKILKDHKDGSRRIIRKYLASGGMAHVYQAESSNPNLPDTAIKMSKDLCDTHNDQTEGTARTVSKFTHHAFPRILRYGRFNEADNDERLCTRKPAFMELELLHKDPLTKLREEKVLGMDEALHPNVALLLAQDLLDYAIELQEHELANGDLHPFQTMMRMPILQTGNELFSYCQNLDGRRFETVVADCDTITKIGEHIPHPVFTLRYGDPWFVNIEDLEFKYTNVTDSYSIMADLFTWLTGHPLLPGDREPNGIEPARKAIWWKDLIETRPLPTGLASSNPPLFTREDIYRRTFPSIGVKVPSRKVTRRSFKEFITRAQAKITTSFSKDQQTIENLVELMCMGLSSPRTRATPHELRQYIADNFPKHEETYGLRDVTTGKFVQRTRVVPQPFVSTPCYASRVQRKASTSKHRRYNIHSGEIALGANSDSQAYSAEELAQFTKEDSGRLTKLAESSGENEKLPDNYK